MNVIQLIDTDYDMQVIVILVLSLFITFFETVKAEKAVDTSSQKDNGNFKIGPEYKLDDDLKRSITIEIAKMNRNGLTEQLEKDWLN